MHRTSEKGPGHRDEQICDSTLLTAVGDLLAGAALVATSGS